MPKWYNPFDDKGGAFQGADPGFQTLGQTGASSAPAPQYGTTRTGGGPAESNFQLGGTANYANDFANRAHETASSGQSGYQGFADVAGGRAADAYGRATPTTDYGQANAALGAAAGGEANQQGVYSGLMNFANGPQGPSGAQALLNEGANRSFRQNLAGARSGTGFGESAAGMAGAQRAHVDATASAANAGAGLRAQEDAAFRNQQLQAFGQAGGVAGQQSQAALGRAGTAAGMSQFQTQAELEAQRARDQSALGFGQQSLDAFGAGRNEVNAAYDRELAAQNANLQGGTALESTRADVYGAELGHQTNSRALNQQNSMNYVGGLTGLLSGGGSLAAAAGSDRRMKKNIRKASLSERYEALT